MIYTFIIEFRFLTIDCFSFEEEFSMYTPGKLDAVMDSDFGLGFLPIPKRTLFADDKQALSEDDDSGLGMEVIQL